MKNNVSGAEKISVTYSGAATSGKLIGVGGLYGVAVHASTSGTSVEIQTRGVFDLPKATSESIAPGTLIYAVSTTSGTVQTSASGALVGAATETSLSAAANVRVMLDGTVRA